MKTELENDSVLNAHKVRTHKFEVTITRGQN